MPTSDLINCAICFRLSPKRRARIFGAGRRRVGLLLDGSAASTWLRRSRAPSPAAPDLCWPAYICCELLGGLPHRAPGKRRCSASTPPASCPARVRDRVAPSDTARTGDGLPCRLRQRAVHPAAVGGLQARACPIPCSPARRSASASGRASRRRPQSPGAAGRTAASEARARDAGRRSHPGRWRRPRGSALEGRGTAMVGRRP